MKILFDALGLPLYGGAKSSALGWIRSVAKRGTEHRFIVLVSGREPVLEGLTNLEQVVAPPSNRFGVRLWAQMHLGRIIRAHNIDLVHFTKNHGCFFVPCPAVITVNDLSRLHYPAMFSQVDVLYWRTIQRAVLSSVNQVIAISENTKRDLIHFYHVPPEKIQVIYPAPAPQFQEGGAIAGDKAETLQKYGIRSPYILSVGGMAVHKNVYTALRAFCSLFDQGELSGYTFVVVGEQIHTHNDQRLFDLADQYGRESIHFAGVVDDEHLPTVYAGASLLVYPSLYEGFGLTPLEAMASGVPVLACPTGSLSEVLGDAAWIVEDAMDVKSIAEGMRLLLTDPLVWERFKQRGLKNVKRFSWAQTAYQTLALYQRLIRN